MARADEIKKLRWRCRRGTKELDVMLTKFVDNHYAKLTKTQQQNFILLLNCTDAQLMDYLCAGITPAANLMEIVEHILQTAHG